LHLRERERERNGKSAEELKYGSREGGAVSIVFKWADEEYAKAYKREKEEERRRSLQFQNEEGYGIVSWMRGDASHGDGTNVQRM